MREHTEVANWCFIGSQSLDSILQEVEGPLVAFEQIWLHLTALLRQTQRTCTGRAHCFRQRNSGRPTLKSALNQVLPCRICHFRLAESAFSATYPLEPFRRDLCHHGTAAVLTLISTQGSTSAYTRAQVITCDTSTGHHLWVAEGRKRWNPSVDPNASSTGPSNT